LQINAGLNNTTIRQIIINSSDHLFVATPGSIFRTSNAGNSWMPVNKGLQSLDIRSLVINANDNIWAGTKNGVFHSVDDGNNWLQINTGLPSIDIQALAINPATGRVFVGMTNAGVFRSIEPTTSIFEEISEKLPLAFSLKQNYPNPFNPATMIEFSLPRSGYVTLKIYNLLGEEIAVLVAEHRTAGKHQIEWNPKELPSGVYLYRLQTEELTKTKKLTIIR
jgi:hypothetical protein